jgi:hypothetical protein
MTSLLPRPFCFFYLGMMDQEHLRRFSFVTVVLHSCSSIVVQMPPKAAAAAAKAGGKNAVAVASAGPALDAPRCLTVTFELAFDQIQQQPAAAGFLKYVFPGCCDAVVSTTVPDPAAAELELPQGWTRPDASNSSSNRLVWSKRHQLAGDGDEAAALLLNKQPQVHAMHTDTAGVALDAWTLDLSCFLSGDVSISKQACAAAITSIPGIASARITVSPDATAPVFSAECLARLNPMTINIKTLSNLPTVGTADTRTAAAPVYVTCRPFSNDRSLVTQSIQHSTRAIKLNHTSVYLTGIMNRSELNEWIETTPIRIEVHDRSYVEIASTATNSANAIAASATSTSDAALIQYAEAKLHARTTAGDSCAHGIATYKLDAALLPGPNAPMVKSTQDVCPSKRRVALTDDDDDLIDNIMNTSNVDSSNSDRTQQLLLQKRSQQLGDYLASNCTLSVSISFAVPLQPVTVDTRLYSRAVYICEYDNSAVVSSLIAAMDSINTAALASQLQSTGCSLRACQFTTEQVAAVSSGALDVICGFSVIDDHCRMIIVEGLADKGLRTLLDQLPRNGRNSGSYRVLADLNVRFVNRMYTAFNAELKLIRLRQPLPLLCQLPELYEQSCTPLNIACYNALDRLRSLRRADRLKQCRDTQLFPTATDLLHLMSKYGESVSHTDMTGVPENTVVVRPRTTTGDTNNASRSSSDNNMMTAQQQQQQLLLSHQQQQSSAALLSTTTTSTSKRKADTDSYNLDFERSIATRTQHDFIAQQTAELQHAKAVYAVTKAQRAAQLAAETVSTEYCYAAQKLNYTELKKEELRARLCKQKNATFTYSKDFVSQTVSLVDEFRVQQTADAKSKSQWMTQKGFKYPAAKQSNEYAIHPHKPSASRIDMLKEPWIENECNTRTTNTNASSTQRFDAATMCGTKDFDCVPSNGAKVFGGLKRAVYTKQFDGTAMHTIGTLPRGQQQPDSCGAQDSSSYFKSVHIASADESHQYKQQLLQQERELWNLKVVVDDLCFRIGGFTVKDKPLQTDRVADILHGPAIKTAFKLVRTTKLPSGKTVEFPTAPISCLSLEPYADPYDKFVAAMREQYGEQHQQQQQQQQLIHNADGTTTAVVSAMKPQFMTRIHSDASKPKSQTIVAGRRKIVPLLAYEKEGPKWRGVATTSGSNATATTSGSSAQSLL